MRSDVLLDRRAASLAMIGASLYPSERLRAATSRLVRGGLRRGVNLSHWFAQPYEATTPKHYLSFVSAGAIRTIARAGMTHLRLCVDPNLLFRSDGPPAIDDSVFKYVLLALDAIATNGLAVVFDLHPVGDGKRSLLTSAGAERFVQNWSLLAERLRARGSPELYLEVLNEPSPLEGDAWWDLQRRAVGAIRAAGFAQPVIVNAGAFSGIEDLVKRKPYQLTNLIYTVHCYEPLLFTHQGADWSWAVAKRVAGLGWPQAPVEARQVARAATADEEASHFVARAVSDGRFTRSAMTDRVDLLKRWQLGSGNPPIYVGEFGVYAKVAPIEARLDWIRSARKLFEKNGWGWCLWDGSSEFGFYPGNRPRDAIDEKMLDALGLEH